MKVIIDGDNEQHSSDIVTTIELPYGVTADECLRDVLMPAMRMLGYHNDSIESAVLTIAEEISGASS